MEPRNCPRCGKMFYYTRSPICPECEKKEEGIFNDLKEYLRENPKSNIAKITSDTNISPKIITKFLREGRLEITEGLQDFLTCQSCGKPINSGRFCSDCASKKSKNIQSAIGHAEKKREQEAASENKHEGPKMHYFKNK